MKRSEKSADFDIKLIFFCGNPGKEYSKTRHNAAWMLLDSLSQSLSWQNKFKGIYAKSDIGNSAILLKPEVYMNLAGECVGPAAAFFKFNPENILVCHDDIELEFGTIAIKYSGGSAGHNGLRSIEKHLGTNNFFRYRLGISRPKNAKVDSHVLGRFSPDEEAILPIYMEKAAAELKDMLKSRIIPGEKIKLI